MICSRRIKITVINEGMEAITVKGYPQDGVLSLLLWNLPVDDILLKLYEIDINIQIYADDMLMTQCCSGSTATSIQTS